MRRSADWGFIISEVVLLIGLAVAGFYFSRWEVATFFLVWLCWLDLTKRIGK